MSLQASPDLIVLEISDPIKDVLFCLLLEYVLLQDLVVSLQLIELLFIFKIGLLQLEVLLSQLGHQDIVHLIQSAYASLICLDQTILRNIKELLKVCEVHLLQLGLTSEDVVQELHQGLCGDVVFA